MGTKKVCTDLTGQKFGKLRVIERVENYVTPKGKVCSQWLCECECGNHKVIRRNDLTCGKTVSCGCYNKEISSRPNDYEIQEDYVIMYTNRGDMFLIDLDDFERVKRIAWRKTKDGYFRGKYNGKTIQLHRFILNVSNEVLVDHQDHDKSNNRKYNLRPVTTSQNGMNRNVASNCKSGVTGVCWYKAKQKWQAQIKINNRQIYLGRYDSFDDAVKARKEAEDKYFGEYSFSNTQENLSLN